MFHRHIVLVTLIPVLAVMVLIFGFSAQDGEKSGSLSQRIAAAVVRVVRPDLDRLEETQRAALLDRAVLIVRKTAHFAEFALLGFFLLLHFRALAASRGLRRPALGAAAAGFLYAASDELHQGFVAGRSPRLLDVGIDGAGLLFGMLAMALLLRFCRAAARRRPGAL